MARESAGGRIGRTVYLPQEVWDELEAYADWKKRHPAIVPGRGRAGSVSSVIEQIVTWDAPAQIIRLEQQLKEAREKIEAVRRLQSSADSTKRQLELSMAGILADLIKLRDLKL